MRLVIRNRNAQKAFQSRKEVLELVEWALGEMLPPRLIPKINLTIEFHRPVCGSLGTCDAVDILERRRPREFVIEISPRQSKTNLLKAMFHELTHLAQYRRKDLGWKGSRGCYSWKNKTAKTADAYWTTPWEIEAYGRETTLYYQYKELGRGARPSKSRVSCKSDRGGRETSH